MKRAKLLHSPSQALQFLRTEFDFGIIGVLILQYVQENPYCLAQDIVNAVVMRVDVSQAEVHIRIVELINAKCLDRERPRRPMTISPEGKQVLAKIKRHIENI
jgi:hypothetical protein